MSTTFDDGDDFKLEQQVDFLLGEKIADEESRSVGSNQLSTASSSSPKSSSENLPTTIETIVLNLKIKYDHLYIRKFVTELTSPDERFKISNRKLSLLQLYTLFILNDPIDTSNQNVCKIYRPTLFTRKNDAFGPFNHYFLLNLFDIEYECPNNFNFPKLWKITNETNVIVKEINFRSNAAENETSKAEGVKNLVDNENTTLFDVLLTICRENKYDERDANAWIASLRSENITTMDHLRTLTKEDWEKLSKIGHVVKQLIRDYMQINTAIRSFDQTKNPYEESTAALIGDIHRVRRYFYYSIKKLHLVPHLSPEAVDLAIKEVRKTYDDDGNILINIHNYLRTFCLENKVEDKKSYEVKVKDWADEVERLKKRQKELVLQIDIGNERRTKARRNLEVSKERRDKIYEYNQKEYDKENILYTTLVTESNRNKSRIEALEKMMEFKLDDQQKKLTVKYGRGLLLYGPPGTGKSELLKRVAIYAGITMTTQPLSAGELNRPYVGETEKLLVDIMYRAHTIPFLICAMTIDEIDGLVPKRDNNAQQSKVDGISVLLSHIEGVKNIPNLIVFGATNRRNMMDEAFLRRMQAKVFVGRPSPAIRSNMLLPLVCKNSQVFTPTRIQSLVKITTNFSGAAIGALKSSLIIEFERGRITEHRLLELADGVAREFNVWFGISTLPEICRINPNIINPADQEDEFSLDFQKMIPTGRILIDYTDRKCRIEIHNEPTLEKDLNKTETSMPHLLARFIYGCSTRNIDTVQIIDLNFLIKQNAFGEDQIFEILTTIFLECNEYNRSMLIFDIDSLIMLNKSDSEMSKSKSISNIRIYQFVREKCKTSIIEETEPDQEVDTKCLRNYVPKEARDGNCYYHPGFVVDINNPKKPMTGEEAQEVLQCAILKKLSEEEMPKLIWACCLHIFSDSSHPCEVGRCGLPKELEGQIDMSQDNYVALVQEKNKENTRAKKKFEEFLQRYRQTTTNKSSADSSGKSTASSMASQFSYKSSSYSS
ncbi:unnamed protein product [Rotaria socialis]